MRGQPELVLMTNTRDLRGSTAQNGDRTSLFVIKDHAIPLKRCPDVGISDT